MEEIPFHTDRAKSARVANMTACRVVGSRCVVVVIPCCRRHETLSGKILYESCNPKPPLSPLEEQQSTGIQYTAATLPASSRFI